MGLAERERANVPSSQDGEAFGIVRPVELGRSKGSWRTKEYDHFGDSATTRTSPRTDDDVPLSQTTRARARACTSTRAARACRARATHAPTERRAAPRRDRGRARDPRAPSRPPR